MPSYPCSCPTEWFDGKRCHKCGWTSDVGTPWREVGPMSEDAQDKRPAANHVGFFARGRYAEEMLVHAEDGTLLGKLLSNHVPTRAESGVVFASIEFTREDVVKRMATGYQL